MHTIRCLAAGSFWAFYGALVLISLVGFIATVYVDVAHGAISPKQHFANALALALQVDCNTTAGLKCTNFTCTPYGNVKINRNEQVFLCHISVRTLGRLKTGYVFFLPDGRSLTVDEVKAAKAAS